MANEEKKTEKNKPKPCPKWLSAAAKKEWRRIAEIFAEEEKEFTDKDLKALEAYCTNYAKWQKCEQIIDEKGYSMEVGDNGYEQQRPEVSIFNTFTDAGQSLERNTGRYTICSKLGKRTATTG